MLPKEIKIGGLRVKIIEKGIDDGANCGLCNFQECWIKIDKLNPIQIKKTALLHEIIEFINIANGLNMNHNQISVLENSLWQVLHDNKIL